MQKSVNGVVLPLSEVISPEKEEEEKRQRSFSYQRQVLGPHCIAGRLLSPTS